MRGPIIINNNIIVVEHCRNNTRRVAVRDEKKINIRHRVALLRRREKYTGAGRVLWTILLGGGGSINDNFFTGVEQLLIHLYQLFIFTMNYNIILEQLKKKKVYL